MFCPLVLHQYFATLQMQQIWDRSEIRGSIWNKNTDNEIIERHDLQHALWRPLSDVKFQNKFLILNRNQKKTDSLMEKRTSRFKILLTLDQNVLFLKNRHRDSVLSLGTESSVRITTRNWIARPWSIYDRKSLFYKRQILCGSTMEDSEMA